MQLLSHAHIECIISGHRIEGWASDDPPYDLENAGDAIEVQEGQDGGLYGNSLPALGGIFRFRVTPASPTAQWAMREEQTRKNNIKDKNPVRVYEMTLTDPVQGRSATCAGMVIMNFPPFSQANQTYEGVMRVEEIITDVDSGTFHPPLTSDAAV